MAGDFSYTVDRHDGTLVVRLFGELDALAAQDLAAVMDRMDGAGLTGVAEVRVDCEDLTYLEAAGISILLRVRAAVVARGASVTLERLQPAQRRVIEATGLEEALHVLDDS